MKKSTLNICFMLVLLAWLSTSCSLAAANQVQSTCFKAIPIETWEELKQNHQCLVLELNGAKLQATMLNRQSQELEQRLTVAEKLLTISEQELTNLNVNLVSVKDLQSRTQISLTELTEQINKEREKQRQIQDRLRLQRTFAYILLGIAVANK